MTDIVDSATRSRMMAGIRSGNTRPELALRRALHARGFRYRLHVGGLPGRPDLVLSRHSTVVFVHGCFWHRHDGCRYATTPGTRSEFWQAKFDANRRRDREVHKALLEEGWRVATIWECALRKPAKVTAVCETLAEWISGTDPVIEVGDENVAPPWCGPVASHGDSP